MPEFEFWPIGASLILMLVAYAAYVFWWLVQPLELTYTIHAPVCKKGQHDVLLDTSLPTGDRLIIVRTLVDTAHVYTAYLKTTKGVSNYYVAESDAKAPVSIELPARRYPKWLTLPDQELKVTLIDTPYGGGDPVRRRFAWPSWRYA
jgi:hypothetical protein